MSLSLHLIHCSHIRFLSSRCDGETFNDVGVLYFECMPIACIFNALKENIVYAKLALKYPP